MCTLTWRTTPAGYGIYFNRDEKRARAEAEPPAGRQHGGIRWLAPRDPGGGGTWIFANEYGVCACLLNYYEAAGTAGPSTGSRSRGLLMDDLAVSESAAALAAAVDAAALAPYGPFWLAAFERGRAQPMVRRWNGERLETPVVTDPPLTTSSYRSGAVAAARGAHFRERVGENDPPAALAAYHRDIDTNDPARGVCMSRADARTVSFTRVEVDTREVRMAYAPRMGDNGFAAETVCTLPARKPA